MLDRSIRIREVFKATPGGIELATSLSGFASDQGARLAVLLAAKRGNNIR